MPYLNGISRLRREKNFERMEATGPQGKKYGCPTLAPITAYLIRDSQPQGINLGASLQPLVCSRKNECNKANAGVTRSDFL